MSVPAALGIDPTVADTVHQVINSSFGSILPSSLQKAVLEGVFSIGRAQLSENILNENNPIGSARLARLRSIFDEGKSLQLQFPAEDLGFMYLEGALLVAGHDNKTLETIENASSYRRGSRDYIPSSKPGCRLPHMQLRMLTAPDEDTFSTLDLVPIDKLEFILIIAPLKDSYNLACVALKVAETFRVSLKVCVIWPRSSNNTRSSGSGKELDPWKNFVDVEEVQRLESKKSWWEICQMTNKGVIFVRPDDHIAWSTEIYLVEDLVRQMEIVFSQIVGVKKTSS